MCFPKMINQSKTKADKPLGGTATLGNWDHIRTQRLPAYLRPWAQIYLYKEDFTSFSEILNEMIQYIIDEKGDEVISERHQKDFKKEAYDEPTKVDSD